MMWFLLLLLYIAHTELIIQDDPKLILSNGSNPCEGHVKIYRNDKWGYVGDKFWSRENEKVVCRSTHCGEPENRLSTDILRPSGSHVFLNEIRCNGNESHLWNCNCPGWSISMYRKETVKKIKCSNIIKIRLDGFKCAGAVQYSTDGKKYQGYFCADNWRKNEGDLVCERLKCGKSKEIVEQEWMGWKEFKTSQKMMIKCSGFEKDLWQCATPVQSLKQCTRPATVICSDHDRLQLKGNTSNVCSGQLETEKSNNWKPVKNKKGNPAAWCQQMFCGTSVTHSQDGNGTQLTCTDNVSVVLMDNNKKESSCYGTVHVKRNDSSYPVCAFTETNAFHMVCSELKCGKMVFSTFKPAEKGVMDNVKCSGYESSLWHCRAKRDSTPFPCVGSAYVVCAGSMNVKLTDGPGKCAGRLEIQYEGRWQRVSNKGWTDANSNTVCQKLNCGNMRNPTNPEKFSQGSGDFLPTTVQCKAFDCDDSINPPKEEAVGITCEGHKVVFLSEDSCSGKVGIEHGNKTYWLSGSNDTWKQEAANTVCRQMQCGDPLSFSSIASADMMKDVWDSNCLSNTTSLFDCKKTTNLSDYNATIATVTCSGNNIVNLTNKCWGNVNVCVGGKCGGVCQDTWTKEKSVMLCKSLGCGDKILHVTSLPVPTEVVFKSLHTTKHTTNLTQCNFIKYDEKDTTCDQNPAYVACSGSVKVRISDSRDKCSGNVEVYYGGQWLPVCMDALNNAKTQNTICEEQNCGQAVKVVDYFGPTSAGPFISQIQCSANDIKSCYITSDKRPCTPGGLQCSSWSKMELQACSGAAFVRSEGKRSAVSTEGWTATVGDRLCLDLKCGNLISNKTITSDYFPDTSFSCADVKNPENIWKCGEQTQPSKELLSIECQDEPKVTLSEKCGGEVKINNIGVCNSNWNNDYSHLVCQEQNCSNAIFTYDKTAQEDERYHVRCEEYHYKLGQCKRYKGMCKTLVSVHCVGNVEFNTSEKCGGQISVKYRNRWENVCPLAKSFPLEFKEQLCREIKCPGHNSSIKETGTKRDSLETQLYCTPDHMDIKHCVRKDSCGEAIPAEIYCNGYVEKTIIGPDGKKLTVPIITGVGIFLFLVILIVILVRICIKNAKKPMNVSSRMSSRKEDEFESGEFEDVTSKASKMEDFSRGRFRSEAEFITENDVHSTSSLSYDDIDEVAESRPLTSQASTAGASGDNYIQEDALDQSADGVTYEVDDPEENYDDIEASPEITQTKVEVHGSPQTTPESVAAAPPGLAQGGGDYLVPGQDG